MRRREFLCSLMLAAALSACSRTTRGQPVPPGATVLAFGDSVTFGTGAAPGEDWPTLLARATGWRIENAGIPGDTAEAGKARLPGLIEQHRPALVIVEIGGNDFLRRRAQSAVKEDLRAIVRGARREGAQVVLVAVPELSLMSVVARKPSDSPIYAELASEEKIPLVPDVFSDILKRPELCADQIHPNAAGYRQMAADLHVVLKKIGVIE